VKKPVSRARKVLAYQRTFNGANNKAPHLDGQIVLEDLRKVARIDSGGLVKGQDGHTDPYASLYRAGLRDMYLRVVMMLGLDEATVFDTTEESGNEPTAST
jgi:hypothetical protein